MNKEERRLIDVKIGYQLRKVRAYRGLTMQKLGLELEISYQQIQKYESGVDRLSGGLIYDVSKILDFPIEFFFIEDDPMTYINKIWQEQKFGQ